MFAQVSALLDGDSISITTSGSRSSRSSASTCITPKRLASSDGISITPIVAALCWKLLLDPSHGVVNLWIGQHIVWLGRPDTAIYAIWVVGVWQNTTYVTLILLAGLRSLPTEPLEAASIDGATWWQRIWYVTLPMMRNIIAITALFSLIVTFANFDIVRVLTKGDPLNTTHVFATWAFRVGIESGDIPLGATVSLFMVPILAVAATFILRDITKRGSEV
jgi:multiple sugar transport system permease protein